MKNLKSIIKFCIPFFVFVAVLSSCEKDSIVPNNPTQKNDTRNLRAIAAAAMSQNDNDSIDFDDCGCYDIFSGIDWENLNGDEIEAALDEVFDNLTEEQEAYLFDPVCTEDGVFESACIADCKEADYHVCSDEELDEYFFGGIDCDSIDWVEFPMDIELPDGSTVTVNNEEELFDALDEWYEENDEWYEEEWYDTFPPIFDDSLDFEVWEECFVTVYPVTVNHDNGSSTTVDSEEEFYDFINDWFENSFDGTDSLDFENFPTIAFPYDVEITETGETITLNDVEDYYEAIDENCD